MTAASLAGGRARFGREPAAEPNVIPFIDVLLVLLIVFMVTAPKPTVDLQLELPNRTAPLTVVIPPTIVDVAEDGQGYRLLVGGRDVALDDLAGAVLNDILAADSVLTEGDAFADARVYVRADQDVAYGNVVAVLDELRHAGFAKVAVFAQAADEG